MTSIKLNTSLSAQSGEIIDYGELGSQLYDINEIQPNVYLGFTQVHLMKNLDSAWIDLVEELIFS